MTCCLPPFLMPSHGADDTQLGQDAYKALGKRRGSRHRAHESSQRATGLATGLSAACSYLCPPSLLRPYEAPRMPACSCLQPCVQATPPPTCSPFPHFEHAVPFPPRPTPCTQAPQPSASPASLSACRTRLTKCQTCSTPTRSVFVQKQTSRARDPNGASMRYSGLPPPSTSMWPCRRQPSVVSWSPHQWLSLCTPPSLHPLLKPNSPAAPCEPPP